MKANEVETLEVIDLDDDGMGLLRTIRDLGLTPAEALARLRKWDDADYEEIEITEEFDIPEFTPVDDDDPDDLSAMDETVSPYEAPAPREPISHVINGIDYGLDIGLALA